MSLPSTTTSTSPAVSPSLPDTPYVYVLVRRDISPIQQVVQAAHVTLELGFLVKRRPEKTCHLVVLGVDNEKELEMYNAILMAEKILCTMFYEPDEHITGFKGYSALATEPLIVKEMPAALSTLSLLKIGDPPQDFLVQH